MLRGSEPPFVKGRIAGSSAATHSLLAHYRNMYTTQRIRLHEIKLFAAHSEVVGSGPISRCFILKLPINGSIGTKGLA